MQESARARASLGCPSAVLRWQPPPPHRARRPTASSETDRPHRTPSQAIRLPKSEWVRSMMLAPSPWSGAAGSRHPSMRHHRSHYLDACGSERCFSETRSTLHRVDVVASPPCFDSARCTGMTVATARFVNPWRVRRRVSVPGTAETLTATRQERTPAPTPPSQPGGMTRPKKRRTSRPKRHTKIELS